jgi:hypothetical protein
MLTISLTAALYTCRNGGLLPQNLKRLGNVLGHQQVVAVKEVLSPSRSPALQEFFMRLTKKISSENRVVIRFPCSGCLQGEWF